MYFVTYILMHVVTSSCVHALCNLPSKIAGQRERENTPERWMSSCFSIKGFICWSITLEHIPTSMVFIVQGGVVQFIHLRTRKWFYNVTLHSNCHGRWSFFNGNDCPEVCGASSTVYALAHTWEQGNGFITPQNVTLHSNCHWRWSFSPSLLQVSIWPVACLHCISVTMLTKVQSFVSLHCYGDASTIMGWAWVSSTPLVSYVVMAHRPSWHAL